MQPPQEPKARIRCLSDVIDEYRLRLDIDVREKIIKNVDECFGDIWMVPEIYAIYVAEVERRFKGYLQDIGDKDEHDRSDDTIEKHFESD